MVRTEVQSELGLKAHSLFGVQPAGRNLFAACKRLNGALFQRLIVVRLHNCHQALAF